ncbi:hypothetical protein DMA11_08055 [Marinilabiliaceae bacterium JC017]|nr:hypothetical protein DMA11_08055 [Marinilabiliaceae bacterium JC017]
MKNANDQHIREKVDDLINGKISGQSIDPGKDFILRLKRRIAQEEQEGSSSKKRIYPYVQLAAAFIGVLLVVNAFILLSSIKQQQSNQELLNSFTEQYTETLDREWWELLASGELYEVAYEKEKNEND